MGGHFLRTGSRALATVATLALATGACGGGGGTHAQTTPGATGKTAGTVAAGSAAGSSADFCAKAATMQSALGGQDSEVSLTDKDAKAKIKAQAAESAAKVDPLVPLAPTEVKRAVQTLDNALHQIANTGDAGAMFALMFDPDMHQLTTYLKDTCGLKTATPTTVDTSPSAACALVTATDAAAFAGAPVHRPNESGVSGCDYEATIGNGTLIISVNINDDDFFLPSAQKGDELLNEPQLGDHGALVTSRVGTTKCVGGKPNKWFTISLGGGTIGNAPNKPWDITAPARRDAFLALCEKAAGRI